MHFISVHDIDLESFNKLSHYPDLIKEIIPSVGKRIKFIEKFNCYIKEVSIRVESHTFYVFVNLK